MPKNYGLNWELELKQQSDKDWIFGATSPVCIAEIPPVERDNCLPKGEVQQGVGDMSDCTVRSVINMLETKLNWLVKNNKLSVITIKFLKDKGFINNKGEVEISDAFTSIKSGTTPQGNSMKAPFESVRIDGICPKKLLPLEKWMTFDDFHKPERITEEIEKIAKDSLRYLGFNYEKVWNSRIGEMLNRDIIGLGGFAWPEPINGEYPRTEEEPNHAFMGIRNPRTFIFDNYIDPCDGDFIKKLASDYKFTNYGYRIIISEKTFTPEEIRQEKLTLIKQMLDIIQKAVDCIKQEINNIKGRLGKLASKLWRNQ